MRRLAVVPVAQLAQVASAADHPEARAVAWRALGASVVVALLASLGWLGPWGTSIALAAPPEATLQVSFDPEASVRLRGKQFVSGSGADLTAVDAVMAGHPDAKAERLFRSSEASLDATRERVRGKGRRDVPDLNRHYRIVAIDTAERDALLGELRALPVVAEAIAEPSPAPLPATPNFSAQQGYGSPAPAGIHTTSLSAFPGGRGEQVKIIDIEYSWNQGHEDLARAAAPGAMIANGVPSDPFPEESASHGTAVLGQLVGSDNGWGVTGLTPASEIGMVNAETTSGWAVAEAVVVAHGRMAPGDVMLLEQQARGFKGLDDYVPVEYVPAVYDAIRLATQDGIIVVEAAGNGSVDLDAPEYGSRFPNGKADSGAIIVGAGSGCSAVVNARLWFSTYGSRVDLQGRGECVTTTGYGDLFSGGSRDSWYTKDFGGTSSASPIVAAAAALYSSVHQATKGTAPTPQAVRSRLVATGTPQAPDVAGRIGPLPNLQALAADFGPTDSATNLVLNPSFESSTSNWAGWQGTLDRVALPDAPHGAHAARVTRSTGTSYSINDSAGGLPATVTSTVAGARYSATASMKAASASAVGKPVRLVLRELTPARTTVREWISSTTMGTTFKRLAVEAVPTASGNWLDIRISQSSAVAGDALYADDFNLQVVRDTAAPTVTSVAPADGAAAVAVATSVSAGFSEAMDAPATQGAFSLARSSDGAQVAGSLSWSGTTLAFKPAAPLAPATTYVARLSTQARDVAGNALAAPREWRFTTQATPTNLIANPSFEASLADWGGWQATVSRVALTGAPHGAYVARVVRSTGTTYTINDGLGRPGFVSNTTAGATYNATAWARGASGSSSGKPVQLILRERTPARVTVREWKGAVTPLSTTTFRQLTVSATTVAAGNSLDVRISQGNAVSGDSFYADSFTVVRTR